MNPLLLFGVIGLGVAAIGAAVSGAIRAQVDKARRELIEVGPNCSFIKLRTVSGEAPSEASVNRAIKKARKYYFDPKIAEVRKLFPPAVMGLDPYAAAAVGFILKDLIPECNWGSDPGINDPRFFIWITLGNWIRIEALTGLECDPLEEAPPGTICVVKDSKHVLAREKV